MTTSDFGADIFDPDDNKPTPASTDDSGSEGKPTRRRTRKKASPSGDKAPTESAGAEDPAAVTTETDEKPARKKAAKKKAAKKKATKKKASKKKATKKKASRKKATKKKAEDAVPEDDGHELQIVEPKVEDQPEPPPEASEAPAPEDTPPATADVEDRAEPATEPESRSRKRRRRRRSPDRIDDEFQEPERRDDRVDEFREPERRDDRVDRVDEDRDLDSDDERRGRRSRRRRSRRPEPVEGHRRPGLPAPSVDTEVHGQRIAVLIDLEALREQAGDRDGELAYGRLLRHLSRRRHLIRAIAYVPESDFAGVASTLQGSGLDARSVTSGALQLELAVDAMALAARIDSVVVLPDNRDLGPLERGLSGLGVRLETADFTASGGRRSRPHLELGEESLILP